jgi:hypothetical protein
MNDKPVEPIPNQAAKYDMADLEEYCLWVYGLYEEDVIQSN